MPNSAAGQVGGGACQPRRSQHELAVCSACGSRVPLGKLLSLHLFLARLGCFPVSIQQVSSRHVIRAAGSEAASRGRGSDGTTGYLSTEHRAVLCFLLREPGGPRIDLTFFGSAMSLSCRHCHGFLSTSPAQGTRARRASFLSVTHSQIPGVHYELIEG